MRKMKQWEIDELVRKLQAEQLAQQKADDDLRMRILNDRLDIEIYLCGDLMR